jgi:mRNA-degrading endonuclease RelE of RelBE toxin-antitoxin system
MIKSVFALIYSPVVREHLKTIERKHYSLIRKTIEEQLTYEPNVETRNRKPLRRPASFSAEWELRLGPDNRFRVFYEIDIEENRVLILAIGEKKGNRFYIGGEEMEV